MNKKFNFTEKRIKELPVAVNRTRYQDTGVNHLYLNVTKTKKTYYYLYKFRGQTEQIKIGEIKETDLLTARKESTKYNNLLNNGENPKTQAARYKKDFTLKELFYEFDRTKDNTPRGYYPDKKDEKKSIDQEQANFHRHLKHFHKLYLSDITQQEVRRLHRSMKDKKTQANRVLALLSCLFSYAMEEGLTANNPCRAIKKYSENPKTRILNVLEQDRFFTVLDEWTQLPNRKMFADIFTIMIYTGIRKSNVLAMQLDAIDLHRKLWTLQAEETKNKKLHTIVLNNKVVFEIIQRRCDELKGKTKWIFPSPVKKGCHIVEIKKQWTNLLKAAALSGVTPHDLRRTNSSELIMQGTDLKTVSDMQGRKSVSTTDKHYAQIHLQHKEEASTTLFPNRKLNRDTQIPFTGSKEA